MPSTNWTNSAVNSTDFDDSVQITNLGATMNSASYIMNDTVLTMNDYKQNPLFGASTNYASSQVTSTNWA